MRFQTPEEFNNFRSKWKRLLLAAISIARSRDPSSLSRHFEYPDITLDWQKFPTASRKYPTNAPIDYSSAVYRTPFARILSDEPDYIEDLIEFTQVRDTIINHDRMSELFSLKTGLIGEPKFAADRVKSIVASQVDRFSHIFGIQSNSDEKKLNYILKPFFSSVLFDNLNLVLIIPILFVHFQKPKFRLTSEVSVQQMTEKLQRSRLAVGTDHLGFPSRVIAPATHAFFCREWSLKAEGSIYDIERNIATISENVYAYSERLFGSLRVSSDMVGGYSQVIFYPRGWNFETKADLIPLYISNVRRFPMGAFNFFSTHQCSELKNDKIEILKRLVSNILESEKRDLDIPIRRLNSIYTRDTIEDAVVDAAVALEALLGDNETEATSYKIRIRAAIVLDRFTSKLNGKEAADEIRKFYGNRSKILHGRKKETTQIITDEIDLSELRPILEIVRELILIFAENPEYIGGVNIDNRLLLSR